MKSPYLIRIQELIEEAEETDYIMPLWLPYLPAIMIGVSVITLATTRVIIESLVKRRFVVLPPMCRLTIMDYTRPVPMYILSFMGTLILMLVGIIGLVLELYVLYRWIKRRNDHFKRTHRLYDNVIAYLRTKGYEEEHLLRLTDILNDMREEEIAKNAVLWIVLYIVFPPIILYIYHFLNRDFYEHERREVRLYSILSKLLHEKVPEAYIPEFERRIPSRNTILYIVLSIITVGIFTLYWIYTITKDPNEHFKEHRKREKNIIEALERLSAS